MHEETIPRKTRPDHQYSIYWEAAGTERFPHCIPMTEYSHKEGGQWMIRYGEYRVFGNGDNGHKMNIVAKGTDSTNQS